MNVNYSASATYALYAIGEMCNRPEFKKEAEEIALGLKEYFTVNDCFLYGEGLISPQKLQTVAVR